MLAGIPFDIVLLADIPGARLPEEGGETYAENALLKARFAARETGLRAIADDSGLEVDALDGRPGVRSARFGGSGLDDAGRVAKLLDALRHVSADRRTARFRCVIALVEPDGSARTVEGTAEGRVLREPRGTGGFGYDPVFFYPPLRRTFAELTPDEKDAVSHRGIAVRALRRLLTGQ